LDWTRLGVLVLALAPEGARASPAMPEQTAWVAMMRRRIIVSRSFWHRRGKDALAPKGEKCARP
jgi:hypothetical protein